MASRPLGERGEGGGWDARCVALEVASPWAPKSGDSHSVCVGTAQVLKVVMVVNRLRFYRGLREPGLPLEITTALVVLTR
jgi:hypothetical protein